MVDWNEYEEMLAEDMARYDYQHELAAEMADYCEDYGPEQMDIRGAWFTHEAQVSGPRGTQQIIQLFARTNDGRVWKHDGQDGSGLLTLWDPRRYVKMVNDCRAIDPTFWSCIGSDANDPDWAREPTGSSEYYDANPNTAD